MSLNKYFKKLYAYNEWATETLLATISTVANPTEYTLKFMSHAVNAQFIWLRRITNHANDYKIWDVHPVEKIKSASKESMALWQDFIANATPADFERVIHYSNSAGDQFSNIVQDCIIHLVNHATYHRAQVAKDLRDTGTVPPNTDYITYCRKFDKNLETA